MHIGKLKNNAKSLVLTVTVISYLFSCANEKSYKIFSGLIGASKNISSSNTVFYRKKDDVISVDHSYFESFVLKINNTLTVEGYWGIIDSTLFFVPKIFSKECKVKYPILFLNDTIFQSHICEAASSDPDNCSKIPILPTQYKIQLLNKEITHTDIVYTLKHSLYEVTNSTDSINNIITMKLSILYGIIDYNYSTPQNQFQIPWIL